MAEKTTPFEHAREALTGYYTHGARNDAIDLDADARQLVIDMGHLIEAFHAERTDATAAPGDLAAVANDLHEIAAGQANSDTPTIHRHATAIRAHRCAPGYLGTPSNYPRGALARLRNVAEGDEFAKADELAVADLQDWHAYHRCAPAEDGAALIAAERRRQVKSEGWTPEHDASHIGEDLVIAACCYALPNTLRRWRTTRQGPDAAGRSELRAFTVPTLWPWEAAAWKPVADDRVRELVKAGALIAAEIDRLGATTPARKLAVGDTVTTVEELDALPVGAVVRSESDGLFERIVEPVVGEGWYAPGYAMPQRPSLPARVLDLPATADGDA